MLGVCLGNRAGKENFTCDAHRRNDGLVVNPFLKLSIDLMCYGHEEIKFINKCF